MSETATISDRRAKQVSLFGLILQTLCSGGLWTLAYFADSDAIEVLARFTTVGIPIWLTLLLVFVQMRRVSAEALETEELKRTRSAGDADGIFELDDEALLLEQNRLRWMIRWILPGTTILVSAFLILGQFVGWGWQMDAVFEPDVLRLTESPAMVMWFIVAAGFVFFLYASYAKELAKIAQWRVIRAGSTIMTGNAMACLLVAICLAASKIEWAEPVVAYIVRALLVIIGIEFALNFVLDLYRPRSPGEIPRPSFDSRLLGLITEPGNIAKSVADAVNYQFGFEVSRTWFYELLQRWFLPIVVLTGLAIFLLTSVVIVGPEERVVVERFGRQLENGERGPGIFLKWPYPIDVVYRAPVRRIDELVIGEALEAEGEEKAHEAVIWTEQHEYVPELMLLVASEREGGGFEKDARDTNATESVPVSLLMVSVPIEYRIRDIHKYLYNYVNPRDLLEAVAYQYLTDYASSVDIGELMGPGREEFNQKLGALIQTRLDELDAGIEIVFVGVMGAHPPAKQDVAKAFQGVIQAEVQQQADVNRAEGIAKRTLVDVAGTEARALELDEAILERNRLKKDDGADPGAVAAADLRVEQLLFGADAAGISPPGGQVASILANARAAASRSISEASNKVRSFETEVAAFEASPELYRRRRQLEIFESLGNIRRYLIAGDPRNVIITYSTEGQATLDKVLSEGVEGD